MIRGLWSFYTCGYCVPHPSSPSSTLHPATLCHFCSLISFTSAFFCRFFFPQIPQLMTGAYPVPLCLALILLSFLLLILFMTIHLPFIKLNKSALFCSISIFFLLSADCFVCEWVYPCFQAHRCAFCLSSHLFSPVIPGLAGLYDPSTPNPP